MTRIIGFKLKKKRGEFFYSFAERINQEKGGEEERKNIGYKEEDKKRKLK